MTGLSVRQAKAIAHRWVEEAGSRTAGFQGAFFAGSINWMQDGDPFPSTSDVDVKIVVDDAVGLPEVTRELLFIDDVALEVVYMSSKWFQSSSAILSDYRSACTFAKPNLILDRSQYLARLQREVMENYAGHAWIRKRCEQAFSELKRSLTMMNETQAIHDQVSSWVFTLIFLAHLFLVADLRNPTMRKCLVSVRETLSRYRLMPQFETMLEFLGCADKGREQVEGLLAACSNSFQAAVEVVRTPFFNTNLLRPEARPLALDGSQELIEQGAHRETVLWILVIHSWCQKALSNDGPAQMRDRLGVHYRTLLDALGIGSWAKLKARQATIEALLPRIWAAAETILEANPAIERSGDGKRPPTS